MHLGLSLGYFTGGDLGAAAAAALDLTRAAEDAGYDSVWVAEAYGTDAVSVLGWLAAGTARIGLGSAVLQVPARAPAAAAMAAATLDALSGGRFRLGLGVSGPQVSHGWYGQPFAKPLLRTREYVDVVRTVLAREPLRLGEGPALKLMQPPPRVDLPLYLAAVGPRNVELAGELADGWLPVFLAPDAGEDQLAALRTGRARSVRAASGAGFDVCPTVAVLVTDATGEERRAAEAPVRAYVALYLGGMGSRTQNFYADLGRRLGFADAVDEVQDHYLAGRYLEAAAAVPAGFLEATCLVGSRATVRSRLDDYERAGVTTLSVLPLATAPQERIETVRALA